MNRLTNMVEGIETTRYAYDAAGQLLSGDGPWADDTVSNTSQNRLRHTLSLASRAPRCGRPTVMIWPAASPGCILALHVGDPHDPFPGTVDDIVREFL